MSSDLISIGITCFNAHATIEKAIQSACAQEWPALEIVVVDDASTDGSGAVLDRLRGADARVRIVRHPQNRGVGAARNSVLEHATGAFVAYFDDDDVSHPSRLSRQHRRIVDYERATGAAVVLCHSASTDIHTDGTTDYAPCLGMDVTPGPSGEEVARLILLGEPTSRGRGFCPTSTLMARRSVYDAVGGFDERLRRHEDTDLNLRLALRGAHFAGVAEPLVVRTLTATSDKVIARERQNALALIDKHKDLLQDWDWYDFSRAWCELKFARLESGTARALPQLARLFLRSPLKTLRKVMWTLPNMPHYAKYRHSHASGA